jgi:hypothetical protein
MGVINLLKAFLIAVRPQACAAARYKTSVIGDFGIMVEARLLTQCSCRNAVSTYLPLVAERLC